MKVGLLMVTGGGRWELGGCVKCVETRVWMRGYYFPICLLFLSLLLLIVLESGVLSPVSFKALPL
jgi:hypothetical protein